MLHAQQPWLEDPRRGPRDNDFSPESTREPQRRAIANNIYKTRETPALFRCNFDSSQQNGG